MNVPYDFLFIMNFLGNGFDTFEKVDFIQFFLFIDNCFIKIKNDLFHFDVYDIMKF